MDMAQPLETLKCAIVYQISSNIIYTVISDNVAVNLERSMITCYFTREIVKQASYCVELQVTTPIGVTYQTSSCQKQLAI